MSDPAADDISVVNEALAAIGSSPINSFSEDTSKAEKAKTVWSSLKRTCLSLHAWTWATRTYPLLRSANPPGNGWTHGFAVPGGVLGGPEAVLRSLSRSQDITRDFAFEDGMIFANCATLWARFRIVPPVDAWSPEFHTAIVTGAAARLAVPISHNQDLAERLSVSAFGEPREGMRGGLMGAAIALDRAKAPRFSPLLADDPLTMARYM